MRYKDLQDLISHSSSTRQYFLSLPVSLQLILHKYNSCIHTAADLHLKADLIRSLPETCIPKNNRKHTL